MNEQTNAGSLSHRNSSSPRSRVTRRDLLRALGAGGAALAGMPLIGSLGANDANAAPRASLRGQTVDVTLITTADLPYPGIPTAEVQAADPALKAYADAVQPWMDENPGVKLQQITFDVYDQQALLVAISGGTAPSFYPADVLGDWNEELVLASEKSGLAADVTDQVAQNDLEAKLADYCLALWKTKAIDGQHYALPYGYNCGDGLYYRVDMFKEAGLEVPTSDWTWQDVRDLAKTLTTGDVKGIGLQGWGLSLPLVAEGWGFTVLRNRLPAPETSWDWKWDFTTSADEWAKIISWFRSMIFEDQSVLADVAMEDDQIVAQFLQGTVAMMNNNSTYFTSSPSPSVDLSFSRVADEMGKPIEEVFGYLPHPAGSNGFTATSWGQLDTMALNPDLDQSALDKAASLHIYMMGPGFVSQKKAAYEASKDLRYVWIGGDVTPLYKPSELEGIPGSPEEAWGEAYMKAVHTVADRPLMPWPHWFIALQSEAGPPETPLDDARDHWFYDSSQPDIMADLKQLEETMNQQAAGFTSEVPDDQFIAGAKAFYDAQAAYWEKNSPDFYNNVYKPFYDSLVAPALG
jgi:hypothetical protein